MTLSWLCCEVTLSCLLQDLRALPAPWNLSSLWCFPLNWTGFLLFFPFFQGGNVPVGSLRGLCCLQGSVPSPTSLMNIRTSLAPPCEGGFFIYIFFFPGRKLTQCLLPFPEFCFISDWGTFQDFFLSDQTLRNRQC